MDKKILVVDDEEKITSMITDYLTSIGYSVIQAYDGKSALESAETEKPDCIVLDVMMPGVDGLDVTRRLREVSFVPIILLTARAQEADKLMGLEVGADDYMVKPFSMKELAARIRALLRRAEHFSETEKQQETIVQYKDIEIDKNKMKITRGREQIALTNVQFSILRQMAENPGKVFTRMELLQTFQDFAYEGYERTIDVHIKNIRKVLEYDPSKPEYILTVWGVGYKAAEE